jgi:hypothetical protein
MNRPKAKSQNAGLAASDNAAMRCFYLTCVAALDRLVSSDSASTKPQVFPSTRTRSNTMQSELRAYQGDLIRANLVRC